MRFFKACKSHTPPLAAITRRVCPFACPRYHVDSFREGILLQETSGGAAAQLAATFRAMKDHGVGRTEGLCRALGVDVRQQEDAQEFKGLLFGALDSSLAPQHAKALSAPFQGVILNALRGLDAPFEKSWKEPFSDLALEATSGSVSKALDKYFQEEVMEGPNAVSAKGLEGKHRASKTVALLEPPEVLCLQLKRFAYGPRGLTKVHAAVAFDEVLDLTPHLARPRPEPGPPAGARAQYRLHAVLVHTGSASTGHYFAFVRRASGWVRCDDTRVSSASWAEVRREGQGGSVGPAGSSAYLLQYVRTDAETSLISTGGPGP